MVDALLRSPYREEAMHDVDALLAELSSLLLGLSLVRDLSARTLDLAASYGERLSAAIIAVALSQAGISAQAVDARRLIVTDDRFGAARWLEAETRSKVSAFFSSFSDCAVVTGFIAATKDGITNNTGARRIGLYRRDSRSMPRC